MNSSAIIIKNGVVVDPLNGINLEKMDILIQNNKITEKINDPNPTVIDAKGKLVLPGGVDIHTHFAGSKVNTGRVLRPEEHNLRYQRRNKTAPMGTGWATPTVELCGYLYAKMGYTFLVEPAIPPLKARHAHHEMANVPFVDKLGLLLLGNNWVVMDLIKKGDMEGLKSYVSWILDATKTYAIKLVAPGSVEAWAWGKTIRTLDEQVPNFNVTPKEIIYALSKVNEELRIPHPIHVHSNNLGFPGNYETTIETLENVKKVHKKSTSNPFLIHLTHAQFSSYNGEDWKTFGSGSEEVADYINRHSHVSFDLGQIVFSNTTTMTADGSWQYTLHKLTGNKWVNFDIEVESGGGVVPYVFHRKNFVNAIQWAIGLELALLVKDPWKTHLTTDHPNAGVFASYPTIIAMLMSKKLRENVIDKLNKKSVKRILLPSLDREFTFYEIALITRSAPSRTLGIKDQGFKEGTPANIAIYDLEPEHVNPSSDYVKIIRGFSNAVLTIKNGAIAYKRGAPYNAFYGSTLYRANSEGMEKVNLVISEYFEKYYTIERENFRIKEEEGKFKKSTVAV